jgi:hypothetical protein
MAYIAPTQPINHVIGLLSTASLDLLWRIDRPTHDGGTASGSRRKAARHFRHGSAACRAAE